MIDELRCFLLIVEHKSFTRAAAPAHLSQPALSAAIQRLEQAFGARLLHRGRRGAEPTAAGRALLPRARAALAAVEDGRRAVEEVEGLRAGEVRIGGGATVCTYFLPEVLAAFRAAHPGVRFVVREAYPDAIRQAVDAGEIDLGIVSQPGHGRQSGCEATGGIPERGDAWRRDELVLVGPPGRRRSEGPFIAFPHGSATRAILEQHFPGASVVMELGSIAAVKGNVRAGIGVALVSRTAVASDVASRRLVILRHPATPIERQFWLVHRGEDRLPPAAAALRTLMLSAERQGGRPARRGRRARR